MYNCIYVTMRYSDRLADHDSLYNAIFKVNNFLESLPSFWIMQSQRSRRRDKGLWEEMVKLNKGSIFIITETQFAIQSQVM